MNFEFPTARRQSAGAGGNSKFKIQTLPSLHSAAG
jgi:hypothetical protein